MGTIMFKHVSCTIPQGLERRFNKRNTQFIQTVADQHLRVKELRAMEIQSTAENPRIREQEETTGLSKELKALKREQIVEKKLSQQLRDNSHELRLLHNQLRVAVVSMKLAEQKVLSENIKEQQREQKRQDVIRVERERIRNNEILLEQEKVDRQKKQAFRNVLLGQMKEAEDRRKVEHQEVLRERDQMNDVLHKIEEEKIADHESLEKRKLRSKQEILKFLGAQKRFKQQERANEVDGYAYFLELQAKRDKIEKIAKEKRLIEGERKMALSDHIGQKLLAIEHEKRQRENLLLDLLVKEHKAKSDARFQEQLEKQLHERIQIRIQKELFRQQYLQYKDDRNKQQEARFLKVKMEKDNEYDAKEKTKAENRRRTTQEHGKAIQEMIEAKRIYNKNEHNDRMREHSFLQLQDRKLQESIERERLNMLRSQPVEVLRYLPAGIICEADRPKLNLPPLQKKKY